MCQPTETQQQSPAATPEVVSAMLGSPCLEVDLAIDTIKNSLACLVEMLARRLRTLSCWCWR